MTNEYPLACPKWELTPDGGIILLSWESDEEAKKTFVFSKQLLVALQTNTTYEGSRTDSMASRNILPCVVEYSPAIAASMGRKTKYPRYITSLESAMLLGDVLLFLGGTMQLGLEKENQWNTDLARWHLDNAPTTTPEAWLAFMENATLRYIHCMEHAVMNLLWILSGRAADTIPNAGRFLTRNVTYPTARGTLGNRYEMSARNVATFFAQKQRLIFVTCMESGAAFKEEENSFFPPEDELLKRPMGYADLIPLQTLNEYFTYLCSPIAKLNLL
jgi:hypothetical protein